jgi:hypothetical protein
MFHLGTFLLTLLVSWGYRTDIKSDKLSLAPYKMTGFVFAIITFRVLLLEIQQVKKAFQWRGGRLLGCCSMQYENFDDKKCEPLPKTVL